MWDTAQTKNTAQCKQPGCSSPEATASIPGSSCDAGGSLTKQPGSACSPVPILDWFTFTGIMRHENCAGQDLKASLICKESRNGPSLPECSRASHPQCLWHWHGQTCSTHPKHTTLPTALHCCAPSQRQCTHPSPSAKETGAKHGLLAFPCPLLRKCISHGTSVCVVKDKLCNHCIRAKHGMMHKPDSDSF